MNSAEWSNTIEPIFSPAPIIQERRSGKDRRQRPISRISRYLLIGQRQNYRRKGDWGKAHAIKPSSTSLTYLVCLLVLAAVLDALFALNVPSARVLWMNPLIEFFINMGWGYCLLSKFVLANLALFVVLLSRNTFSGERILGTICLCYGLVAIYQVFSFLGVFLPS